MKKIKLQQGGNPIGQYGNASDYYNQITSGIMSSGIFDKFLKQTPTGDPSKDALNKANAEKNIQPALAFASLFKLADMSKNSAARNKPIFRDMSMKTASWTGQEGGDGGQDQMPQQEEQQAPDINEIFSILKQYAEDKGFTNDDGSITKNNMKELILLLETDTEAEFEREKLMEVLPIFAEEKNPEEALRNYWNRGVIPMNRREDVLKYGSPDVEFLQEGRNFKAPQSEEYRQRMGYKDRSPYKDLPQQTFNTDSITMEGVSQPLLGVANNGMSTIMEPGNNYYFPGATSVTEYPITAYNGAAIPSFQDMDSMENPIMAAKQGGLISLFQDNGAVVDNYDYRASELGPEAVITATRLPKKEYPSYNPELLNLEFSPLAASLKLAADLQELEDNETLRAFEEMQKKQDVDRMLRSMLNLVQAPGVQSTVYSPQELLQQGPQQMAQGGIPDRYKKMGFTKVGQKKQSNRPGKKWMVLAKKGDQYKIVHGGAAGMSDFTKHRNENRRDRFWDRMGGKNSSKAKDPFSPLYWHKRFGTWQDGGFLRKYQDVGQIRPYQPGEMYSKQKQAERSLIDYFGIPQEKMMGLIFGQEKPPSALMTGNEWGSKFMGKENYGLLADLVLDPLNFLRIPKLNYGMKGELEDWDKLQKILFSLWAGSKINNSGLYSDRIKEISKGK